MESEIEERGSKPRPQRTLLTTRPKSEGSATSLDFSFLSPPRPIKRLGRRRRKLRSVAGYQLPITLSSPSDLFNIRKFVGGRWIPRKTDVLAYDRKRKIRGVPDGLEFLHLSNHLYAQQCFSRDFPEGISRSLGPNTVNRYHVLDGDTRNRIYYGVAKYPPSTGCWRASRPFRLVLLTRLLNPILVIRSNASSFWQLKVTVTGPRNVCYGSIIQRWSWCGWMDNVFDIYDGKGRWLFVINGYPGQFFKFKLLKVVKRFGEDPEYKEIGIFLESSYGVGNRNMTNALRIGFPQSLNFKHKALILGSLFTIYFKHYELGDEHSGAGGYMRLPCCRRPVQTYRPLMRINPFYAGRLHRPYGYRPFGLNRPYLIIVLMFFMVAMFFIFIAVEDRWAFDFAELFIDVNISFNPWFRNKTIFDIRYRYWGNNETRNKYAELVLDAFNANYSYENSSNENSSHEDLSDLF